MEYNHPKLFVSHLLSLSVATLLVKTKSCSYTYSQLVACLCPIFHKIISESWTSKKHMKPPEQVKLHNSLHEMSIFLDAANTHTFWASEQGWVNIPACTETHLCWVAPSPSRNPRNQHSTVCEESFRVMGKVSVSCLTPLSCGIEQI